MALGRSGSVARILVKGALLAVAIALVANVAFLAFTIRSRPLDGVEGELLFEASRLRQGLPLYVDPLKGAFDYGSVPARYYVLYLPLFSKLLSLIPAPAAAFSARLLSTVAWFGLLLAIVFSARKDLRTQAAWAAAFAGGTYTLTLFGASGRPDGFAVAVAGIAALRTVRNQRVDIWSSALFALAACIKPNVVGLGAGMLGVDLAGRRKAYDAWLGGAAVLILILGTLEATTHGAWLTHFLRSTAQPLSVRQWFDQIAGRGQVMGAFVGLALATSVSARGDRGMGLACGALATATGLAVLWAAKIGSASNYWLEPCAGAVLVFAHQPVSVVASRFGRLGPPLLVIQALWSSVASVRSCWEWRGLVGERLRALALAREGLGPEAVVIADEPGLEMELNGRIVTTPFQMTHLVRRGLYPASDWVADVSKDEVRGLVVQDDIVERPIEQTDVERDRFPPELRRRLRELFVLRQAEGGYFVYRRKASPQ